ncbi:hypothetical protein MAM1_0174d07244 [Mucor ambiguus]|uniref:Uncharacterized protein n=1 Tax=Mucor ambiguus TaxID=91626 RepID=A0A0C9MB03_9FUNG|nr:hypothetical protein MAM1_0174d07244 [Mucor ambiguus]
MCCAEGEALLAPSITHLPTILDLLKRNDAIAKKFKQDIRSYNSAPSFTFKNADLDRRYANEKHGAYAFRIHASQPKFEQINIFDSANELQNRLNVAGIPDVRTHTMQFLKNMMHDGILANQAETVAVIIESSGANKFLS